MGRDVDMFVAQIKGTALANNWRPMAVVRARRQGLVGANLNRYVEAVGAKMTSVEDLANKFNQ